MSSNFIDLQVDMRRATVKEIQECIKALNDKLPNHQRISPSGKKDEIIIRLLRFVQTCLDNDRRATVQSIVNIVNENASRKLCWRYEDDSIMVSDRPSSSRAPPRAPANSSSISELNFVPSPFMKPLHLLTPIRVCPVAGQSRQSKTFMFTLTDAHRQLLASPHACDDRSPYQIRFYCSRYNGTNRNLQVEFPGVCELKVNDTTIVGHNLRCLKGKPGTVNPPDLSIMSKKNAQNFVELVYINSDVSFIAGVYIVERIPVQTLIDNMKKTRVLSKEDVLTKIQQTQEDADIIMESETLSTKCPLAFTRIVTPIRSKNCLHLQCFDATTFLTMNEQTPTWSCPVCYRKIHVFDDLIVDEYFAEMLKNTPKHISSVRVEPNGCITIIDENPDEADESEESEDDTPAPVKEEPEITILDDDDDDEVEDSQNNHSGSQHIPHTRDSADEASQTPRKKLRSDVIDLTFDSDSDDVPVVSRDGSREESSNHQRSLSFNYNSNTQDSQQSNNEALILPHTATLYNGTT